MKGATDSLHDGGCGAQGGFSEAVSMSVFVQFLGFRQYKMSNPFDVTENDSYSSRSLTSMASSINDEYMSSSTKSSTSESQKISLIPVFF